MGCSVEKVWLCGGRFSGKALLLAVLLAGGCFLGAPGAWGGELPAVREGVLRPGEVFPVIQPLPGGCLFYVHRPESFPEGWFATLEGYPVRVLAGGTWVFGFATPLGWRSTACLVGTLDPAAVGIVPMTSPKTLPPGLPSPLQVRNNAPEDGIGELRLPGWAQNDRFREVASWRSTVDRMGVLMKPPVVLAWKGEAPSVVHAWTGGDWLSLSPRPGEDLDHLLARHLYTLSQLLHRNAVVWGGTDTTLLMASCTSWGYLWSGVLALELFP